MKLFMKLALFVLLYLVIFQFLLPHAVPASTVYNSRMEYDIVKNNIDNVEAVLYNIKNFINDRKLKEYVVILGDSVGYSSPCGDSSSLAYYLNQMAEKEGYDARFFNLSLPSQYPGDTYTLLKLMEKHGISSEHVIIDFYYPEFRSSKYSTSVFWMKQQLMDVDYEAYKRVYSEKTSFKLLKDAIAHKLNANLSILMYKDYFRSFMTDEIGMMTGTYRENIGDIRPWYKKKELPEIMKEEKNRWYFSDAPFVMDESNPAIYFINKILENQKNKDTLIFLTAVNRRLLPEETSKKGYNDNIKKIDDYFKSKPVTYVNYDRQLDYNLYTDFVHQTPEGYKLLAADLWSKVKKNLN